LAAKRVHVTGGIIDPDYIDSVKVLLENRGTAVHRVNRGDAIAQYILHETRFPDLLELKERPVSLLLFKNTNLNIFK
jgi:dUTPase